jgi:excisionase family DNA binding protein
MQDQPKEKTLLTVAQVAMRLGMRESTIRQWVWERKVAYIKVGRSVRFRPEVIDHLIAQGEVPARRQ